MVTKWKKCKEWLSVKNNNRLVAEVSGVLFAIILIVVVIQLVGAYYSPLCVVFLFLCAMSGIVSAFRVIMMNLNRKAEGLDDLAFGRYYFKIFVFELVGCMVYAFIVTGILTAGYTMSRTSYWNDFVLYDMSWILALIYIVPIASSAIPVIVESEKARNLRAGMLNEKLRYEQKLAIEEKDKAIEEQGKAVQEQNKANQLSVELLTNVTHDLKTPLTAIIGYLALMEKEELSSVMSDYLKVVTQKSELLKEMIDKILELSKANSGKATLDMKRLNLNKLVLQLVSDIEDTYPDRKLPFRTMLSEEELFFMGDAMYAYRIVQNLLDNAVKYSLEGTRIFVKTYKSEGKVNLEIINVSAYPLDSNEDELKGKFVRGDKSRNTEGNGLGLAIVDAYTHALGGEFCIDIIGDTFRTVCSFGTVVSDPVSQPSGTGI